MLAANARAYIVTAYDLGRQLLWDKVRSGASFGLM
jgi:hypothetical protein